jgi:Ca2+-binding EF-hand superfamily protein
MRKLSIATTLLIALTGCGTAPGMMGLRQASTPATATSQADRAKKAFERIDADKNGAISFEEFQAGKGPHARQAPPDLDTDKDGKISFDEFKAHKPANPPANAPAITDEQLKAAFDKMDTNKDGFLSADDKPQGRPGFAGPGFGGPGFGGKHPFGGPQGFRGHGPKGPAFFGADADKDGKITLDELKAAKGPDGNTIAADKAQAMFDKLDTNKDGAISKDDRPAKGQKPAK